MFRRPRPLRDPVTIYLDGDAVPAERGEPLAIALLAADKTILARSPKLHRPRSASCLRGGCDGCLARVDGEPNVMTCLVPARGGEKITSQNVVGSRKADLLRVTDWFFKQGIDHHHLMAGVPGLGDVMLVFARKVAGLGRVPSEVEAAKPARRRAVDVAVIGAGVSGLVAASTIAQAGVKVLLIDDAPAIGGALVGAPSELDRVLKAHPQARVETLSGAVAGGMYERELLVVDRDGALLITPRAIVFATGGHDGGHAFGGNDLPGVMSARALARLLAAGIEPDGVVVVAGRGPWADRITEALPAAVRVEANDLVAAHGTAGVTSIEVKVGGKTKKIGASVLAIDAPSAPAFELAVQAGAATRFDATRGYVVVTDERGRAATNVWAVGECVGADFDVDALTRRAQTVARDVLAELG